MSKKAEELAYQLKLIDTPATCQAGGWVAQKILQKSPTKEEKSPGERGTRDFSLIRERISLNDNTEQ
jgi:hypothetical protein